MASERTDAAGYLGWFFFGAAVGAVAALLTAPRTGRETRDLLARQGAEAARRAQELATDAQGRAGEWIDRGRDLMTEQAQRFRSAFEAGKEAAREEIRKGGVTPA